MSKKCGSAKVNSANLQTLSTDDLRCLLRELENEHDIIEAKNEELATHVRQS